MGYTTRFEGRLNFNRDLPITAISKLKTILGEDCREHPEWVRDDLTYIDFELTEDMLGIEWNGAEKSYVMVDKVNLIIKLMKEDFPSFQLTGELLAQGPAAGDVWILKMDSNIAREIPIKPKDESKSYIVVCESWEYNDEYYYQPVDGGYTLHEPKLYTEEEAKALCDEMNGKTSQHLTRWDDEIEEEVKIKPYKIIKLEI